MRNRLLFSTNNIVYEWRKYNAILHYKWNKYDINTQYLYAWNKYKTTGQESITYYWKQYEGLLNTYYFTFEKETLNSELRYVWGKYSVIEEEEFVYHAVGPIEESYPGALGKQDITLYEEPRDDSPTHTYYNGIDYDMWERLTPDFKYYFVNGAWHFVSEVWMGGNGTMVAWQDTEVRQEMVEKQGDYISSIVDTDQNAYPSNGVKDGFWYAYVGTQTTTWYAANGEKGDYTISGTLRRSNTKPSIDRTNGKYALVSEDGDGLYGIDEGSNYYYIIPGNIQGDVIIGGVKITSASFSEGSVEEIGDYLGIGGLNASYYQIADYSEYIKGPYIQDVESEDRDAYPDNGAKDNYWYEYKTSSSTLGYIWKKYSLNETTTTTYHWNYYKPKYKWNKFEYSAANVSNISSVDKIDWYKFVPNDTAYSNAIIRVCVDGVAVGSIDYMFVPGSTSPSALEANSSLIIDCGGSQNGVLSLRPVLDDFFITYTKKADVEIKGAASVKIYRDDDNNIFIYGTQSQTKGQLIGEVESDNPSAYPNAGVFDGYYYEFVEQEKGEYIGQVSSLNGADYPDGWSGVFYYESLPSTSETTYSKGAYIEEVQDASLSAYPANGKKDGFWFIYDRNISNLQKGEFVENVYDTNEAAYPQDGVADDNFWYVKAGSTPQYYRGNLVGYADALTPDAYPEDGKQGNNWYAAIGTFYTKGTDELGSIQDFEANAYPQDGEFGGLWYVFDKQTYLTLDTLTDADLYNGVSYHQEVNDNNELMFGMVGGASISFEMENADHKTADYLGATIDWYVRFMEETEEVHIGSFTVSEVHRNKNKASVVALDKIAKFDVDASEWAARQNSQMTISALADSLSRFVGVPIIFDEGLANVGQIVSFGFTAEGLTARQVLSSIAEAMGGFAVANKAGDVVIRTYKLTDKVIDNSKYIKATIADYAVAPIDKVNVATENGNVVVGSGSNAYLVQDNGLFNNRTETLARNLLDVIGSYSYIPITVDLYKDFGINCGDIIIVDGNSTFVQSKAIDSSGVHLSSVGVEKRSPKYNEVSAKMAEMSGAISKVNDEMDFMVSKMGDTMATVSEIDQKVDSIRLGVHNSDEKSEITLTIDGVEVSSKEITMNGKVSFVNLVAPGETVINGSNIKTGTIEAQHIAADTIEITSAGTIKPYRGSTGFSQTSGVALQAFTKGGAQTLYTHLCATTDSGAKIGTFNGDSYFNTPVSQVYTNPYRAQMEMNNHYIGVDYDKCYASESLTITSDREKKKDIQDLNYGEIFRRLTPRRYKMRDGQSDRFHTGFVAQEVKEAVEEAGYSTEDFAGYCEWQDEDGTQTCGLRYEEFIALNTEMIQKLQARIEELEKKVEELSQ